jgi:solute:Na+ symporter, SSS family
MRLAALDWIIIGLSMVVTLWIGVRFTKRASASTEDFFLSGRSLPWWLAGTSMVATSFAADTPLVVSGLVREGGIWKNWVWWCFSLSGMLSVFLFARWWRRGGITTKAEIVELRYGGPSAQVLRGTLGVLHAVWTNTIIMAWILLAALKIVDVLFGVDPFWALVISCAVALLYSTSAGLWGVVIVNSFQFTLSIVGAVVLGVLAWQAVGGGDGILAAAAQGVFQPGTLALLPPPGPGGFFEPGFWTAPVAAFAVYMGVSWWAAESVDGASAAVQLISATKDERHGLLATLWFNIAHYALRPWPWIMVGLASIILLPTIEVRAPVAGTITTVTADEVVMQPADGGAPLTLALLPAADEPAWKPLPGRKLEPGNEVAAGALLARTDPERAYIVMMIRLLPVGLLGLMVASLLAAFMAVDTHINLASSFFVNDVYRRFLRPDAEARHYVTVGRIASVGVMALAGVVAWGADSIIDLFLFFLSFLSGVGPVYLLRWTWWRVRASTELTAMLASGAATLVLTFWKPHWDLGPLSPDGELAPGGRLVLVVGFSLLCSLLSMLLTRTPDPATLVPFYRRVRPLGAWGPVSALAPDVPRPRELLPVTVGVLGGLSAIMGLMFAIGFLLLQRHGDAAVAGTCVVAGTAAIAWSLRRLTAV